MRNVPGFRLKSKLARTKIFRAGQLADKHVGFAYASQLSAFTYFVISPFPQTSAPA